MTNKKALFCASMLGGMLAAASAVASPVLPSGGQVAAGSAAIGGASGASLTVSQTSSKAIVDWSSFGVGQGGTVQFNNGAGATLNRVTGASVSSIDGLLSATGSVYLINPNGVIVGKTGVVNTGGSFVASTLDVGNASFLAGGPLTFSGQSTASVINLGKVGSLGGNVGLIAATVRNDGTIQAARGEAGLAAGTTVTLDDAANDAGGLFSVKVGGASTSATNTGAISAAAVELRAQQGNVYALAGNAGGVINATGIDASGGTIKLISTGGTTQVAGTLSAQGPNGAGGQIETSGETLDIGAANVNAHGGSWLLDPTNLIINSTAATAIDASLASSNVTLTTTNSGAPTETGGSGGVGDTASGNGDIIVIAPMSWSSASLLTLNAFAGITIAAPITVKGGGRLAMNYGATSSLIFQLGGDVQFTGAEGGGQTLGINGQAYTLLYKFANSGSHGSDTGLDDIAGIDLNVAAGQDSGFYALAQNVTATGTFTAIPVGSGGFDGVLEGLGNTISGFTLNIGAGNYGGVIGKISATGSVRDLGVVGGSVSGGGFTGGLAGFNYGTVSGDHTAMIVTGTEQVGGLIGGSSGLVSRSYATGAVSAVDVAGGLIGSNGSTVELSYATGRVIASTEGAGGLVGLNYNGGTIASSYATGAVISPVNAGGLLGDNDAGVNDLVENSYATGAVLSAGITAGGLIGTNDGTISNSYFDTQTTGRSNGIGEDDIGTQSGNVHGLATATFQTATAATNLGTAFRGGPRLYPFLTTFFPNGVQAVSGIVYSDGGGAPIAGGTVSVVGNGAAFDTVTSGANGYYYAFGPSGSIATGQSLLAYDITDTAATLATSTGAASQSDVDLFGKTVTVTTSAITLSTAPTLAQAKTSDIAADGGLVAVTNFINADTSLGLISTGASFTVNQTTSTAGLVIETIGSAPLQVLNPITLTGNGALGLDASGVLGIDAAVKVTGGGQVNLDGSKFGFDLGTTSFAGSLSYGRQGTEGIPGQALTINGTVYKLLYSMTDVAGINGTAGHDALAAPITSTTGFMNSVAVSFSGTLEGLGNTITNLNIDSTGSKVGLIGTLNSGALVRDIKLTNALVEGASSVGDLVGDNAAGATIMDAVAGGFTIDTGGGPDVGGLVGDNSGSVTLSTASTTVENNGAGFATGGLVGFNASGGAISNSSASGPVTGAASYTGGLVGYDAGALSSVSSTGNVSAPGELYVGGLAGYVAAGGTIIGASASGATVSAVGGANVGGLVGINFGAVSDSTASDTVVNSNHGTSAGGLVGYNAGTGSIVDSGASGAVNVGDNVHFAGGLVGYNIGAIDNDSATGNVSGPSSSYIGGLVGYNAAGGQVSSDFASGASISAAGSVAVGGLAGYNAGTIANTYADIGGVTGATDVGGLVGYNAGAVSLSWSSGAVTGTTIVGGSIGNETAAGSLAHVFWDKGTSGRTVGSGAGSTAGLTAIGGTTGLDPHTQATYTGFNLTTIWTINAGSSRAFLRNPTPPTPPT